MSRNPPKLSPEGMSIALGSASTLNYTPLAHRLEKRVHEAFFKMYGRKTTLLSADIARLWYRAGGPQFVESDIVNVMPSLIAAEEEKLAGKPEPFVGHGTAALSDTSDKAYDATVATAAEVAMLVMSKQHHGTLSAGARKGVHDALCVVIKAAYAGFPKKMMP